MDPKDFKGQGGFSIVGDSSGLAVNIENVEAPAVCLNLGDPQFDATLSFCSLLREILQANAPLGMRLIARVSLVANASRCPYVLDMFLCYLTGQTVQGPQFYGLQHGISRMAASERILDGFAQLRASGLADDVEAMIDARDRSAAHKKSTAILPKPREDKMLIPSTMPAGEYDVEFVAAKSSKIVTCKVKVVGDVIHFTTPDKKKHTANRKTARWITQVDGEGVPTDGALQFIRAKFLSKNSKKAA